MKVRVCRAIPLLLILAVVACHAPVTITTPQGQIAYTADQIAVRVGELQNAAIQANATGGLSTANTRIVVEFATTVAPILKATPSGWQTTVATAWTQAKKQLAPVTNVAVVSAMSAVDLVLAAFLGG